MHAWQTLLLALILTVLAAATWAVLDRRAQPLHSARRRTTALVAMLSSAAGLSVVHFGVAFFRSSVTSDALDNPRAFLSSIQAAWPLLFFPWSAWVFLAAVGLMRGEAATRHSRWTGVVHAVVCASLVILAVKGPVLGGFFHPHDSARDEGDFIPALQGLFAGLALLGLVAGALLAGTPREPVSPMEGAR